MKASCTHPPLHRSLILLSIFLLFGFAGSHAEVIPFSDINLISGSLWGVRSVCAADLDGDGDLDAVAASWRDDKISWYENLDGLGTFSTQRLISHDADHAIDVACADLDGDGDIDVISASSWDDNIRWYENDGQGSFVTQHVVFDNLDYAASVNTGDVDLDGDMDIIAGGDYFSGRMSWFENLDGLGTFGSEQIIESEADWCRSVALVDVNGDGFPDAVGNYIDGLNWYENDAGTGFLQNPHQIENTPNTMYVCAADFDADSDLDFACDSGDAIRWYENVDGLGHFTTDHLLIMDPGYSEAATATDVDGDTDMDFVVNLGGELVWVENMDGMGTFTSLTEIATPTWYTTWDVEAADIDNDGDQDILTATSEEENGGDSALRWYENLDGAGTYSDENFIAPIGYGRVVQSDIDGDGDPDFVCTSGSYYDGDQQLVWLENEDGEGGFLHHVIDPDIGWLDRLLAEDMDGDGDTDVVISAGWWFAPDNEHRISWYENLDGNGTFSSENIIISPYELPSPNICQLTDLNGDGINDIVFFADSQELNREDVYWIQSNGNGNFSDPILTVEDVISIRTVGSMDIDSDGDNDLVMHHAAWAPLVWHENLDGNGTFDTEGSEIGSDNFAAIYRVAGVDLDNDGDLDVVGTRGSVLFWFEQLTDGFAAVAYISNGNYDSEEFTCADLDQDGDLDVLGVSDSEQPGTVFCWENLDGEGTFGEPWAIDTNIGARSIIVVDVDGDEALDIMIGGGGNLGWYRNEGGTRPALLTLSGVTTEIPANGGPLVYDARFQYNLPDPVPQASYWANVILPSGETIGPVMRQRFSVSPGMDITRTITHDVPGSAPGGTYTYIGMVGFYPNALLTDTFSFTKAGTVPGEDYASGMWPTKGGFGSLTVDVATTSLHNEFRLDPVYPNPFNASATVRVSLPAASRLTVSVYNLLGERVAELASGRYSAGGHSFTFDGGDLASGIYIVQARTPGHAIETQKVVLLK